LARNHITTSLASGGILVDIAKLLKYEPFGSFQSSIGLLCCFSSSMKDQSLLDEELAAKLEDTAPEDFARAFARLVCFPKDSLKDGKNKPDEPVLQEADVQRLTTEDLEAFAQLYVENNPYLFKKREQKRKKDAEGNTVVTPYFGEIEHSRIEDESYVRYLHRLTVIEREQQHEQLRKITQSFSSFSGGVAENLRKTLSHGDALKRALGQLRPEIPEGNFTIEPRQPDIDWAEMHRNAEAARRAPFDDLAERLDQLIDSSVESSRFMIESNQIQAQVAEEIKKSGDSASGFSKVNLWLSGLITFLHSLRTRYNGLFPETGLKAERTSPRV
ncbi:MAG: hypothetical protein MZV65_46955, partial [Chromatiales bacterium]|nr:hypothetical protein [Chromatiales bacterium]